MADEPTVPPAPLTFQVTFDAVDPHAQARFWAAVLHYEVEAHDAFVRQLHERGAVSDDDVVVVDGVMHFREAVAIRPPGADQGEARANRRLLFMAVPEPRTGKNRVHLDVHVTDHTRTPEAAERLEAEVARLEVLGASVLWRHDEADGRWVTLADPEGNELCLN